MPYQGNYINDSQIPNWPSGTTDAEKQEAIEVAEARLEAALQRSYYPKPLVIKINGNGKNRIFLPIREKIMSISSVRISGVVLDASWYTFDGASVFIDLSTSGSGPFSPELEYLLSETETEVIFPRGYNNIWIDGTCGSPVPAWAKRAARMLVEYMNDPTLYTNYLMGSESISKYSYSFSGPATLYKTGIREIDELIRPFCGKKAIILAP